MIAHGAASDDALYGLVDLSPPAPAREVPAPPAPAAEVSPPLPSPSPPSQSPTTAPQPPSGSKGFLGRLLRRERSTPEVAPAPPTSPELAPSKPEAPAGPRLVVRKKRQWTWKYDAPAWMVSALVHLGILGALAVVAVTAEIIEKPPSIDSAPFDPKLSNSMADEVMPIIAPPSAAPRNMLGGSSTATPGGASGLGTGTGPPSPTPSVGVASAVGEGALPQVKVVSRTSGLALLPKGAVNIDFANRPGRGGGGGNGGFAGDAAAPTKDIGEALDQLAREILRHLSAHKLTVIWLFDESGSMKDDQRAVKDQFALVSRGLKLNIDEEKKAQNALNHVVVGFGSEIHPEVEKPTANIDTIGKAIENLFVDQTGAERTCTTIARVVNEYAKKMSSDRRMILVLVTDESGDDGENVEEARQALVSYGVPLYVIGRQSLFGYSRAHLLYVDPLTKEHYWPEIRRGPESADRECLQIDGLHERWDEQPSGFAPYELARLTRDSGGIYFLLPSEENMRVRQREKAYSSAWLREYMPSYDNRAAYFARREKSELGRLLHDIIEITAKDFVHRRHYPIDPAECQAAMLEEGPKARARLAQYMEMETRLKAAAKLREREPDKRWQAHYDLILAQVVAYQVKTYEFLACLDESIALIQKGKLVPSKMPVPEVLSVNWIINHSTERKAPKQETEKKYAEAKRLMDLVIKNHPNTPWSDLAQDELNRGFGCQRNEEHHGPNYSERAKYVPNY